MDPEEKTALDTGDTPAPTGDSPAPTGDNPNAGPDQAPVPDVSPVEDDATGVNAAAAAQRQQQGPQRYPQGPNRNGIMGYLMGAGASHPSTLEQAGRQVDPEGKMSPSDRNMYALSKIRETEGENAAWQIMQANRVSYNAKTAFAKTALTGNGQKPADIHAALQAANDAQTHVLDGSNVVFSLHNGMVTATVTAPGSKEQQHISLSPQAFAQFLDVGGDGQWDKVMDQSAPVVLQRLAGSQQPQAPVQGSPQQQPQQQQPQQQPQQAAAPAPQAGEPAKQPGKVIRREYQPPEFTGDLDEKQERERRSYAMFPRAHLDVDQNARREEWLNSEGRADTKEEIEDKKASHQWTVESSRIKAAGGEAAARIKAESAARQQQARALEIANKMANDNSNQQLRENGKNARAILNSVNWLSQTDAERAKVLKQFGINAPLPPIEPDAAPAAGAPAAGAGEKREYKGKMYTREEYERDVLGKH